MKKKGSFLKLMFKKILMEKRIAIWVSVLMLLAVLFGQAVPFINSFLVDSVIMPAKLDALWMFILVISVVLILEAICSFGQKYYLNNIGYRVAKDVKVEVFKSLLSRDYEYFETHQQGEIILRINNASKKVGDYITKDFSSLILNSLRLLIILIFMISLNYILGFILLGLFLIIAFIMLIYTKSFSKRVLDFKSTEVVVNGYLLDFITGHTINQVYNRQCRTLNNVERVSVKHAYNRRRYANLKYAFMPTTHFLASIATVFVYLISFYFMASGSIEIGIIVAFLGYVSDTYTPIRNITMSLIDLTNAAGYGEKLIELLDEEKPAKKESKISDLPDIEFINVSNRHSYKGPVLEDINLEIKFGENVLILGPHGSGKTTIGMLLLGLYKTSKGKIKIGGRSIKNINDKQLHSIIGYAGSNPYIFKSTIYENVLMAKPDATKEEVLNAITLSGLGEVAAKLKKGVNTLIRDEYMFSEGDRQLVGIARIILKDPKIIILDEIFLNTDIKTKQKYQEVLANYGYDKTIIYISGTKNINIIFDKVVTLKKGKIVDIKNQQ